MAGSVQTSKNNITLKGSAAIVAEFFNYGVNSILYQRGLFPAESFERVQEYGLPLIMTNDEELKKYLTEIISQVKEWLVKRTVEKLVLIIMNLETREVLERWQFDIECDRTVSDEQCTKPGDEGDIKKEIAKVIKQIVASVTFLPLLDERCSFDILIYTSLDCTTPGTWSETGPCQIINSAEVRLRSFTTGVHKVEGMVAYKNTDTSPALGL